MIDDKDRVLIVNHYPIYPPVSGGQLRIYHISKNLRKYFDVEVLTLSSPLKQHRTLTYNEGMIKSIPSSSVIPGMFLSKLSKLPIGDVVLSYSSNLAFEFKKILKMGIHSSDITSLDHPYLSSLVSRYVQDRFLVYTAHNVEYSLKGDFFPEWPIISDVFMHRIKTIEKRACTTSSKILTTSEDDKKKLSQIYDVAIEKIDVSPNGVDCNEIKPCTASEKNKAKQKLEVGDKMVLSFLGSGHLPNIEAARYVASNLARRLDKYVFLIAGGASMDIKHKHKNVKVLGIVDNDIKKTILNATDIALNPMFHGSGTNLKMLEYLAAGLPTVSTPIGSRGLEVADYKNVIISEGEGFAEKIEELFANDKLRKNLAINGRRLVEERYDWKIITEGIAEVYRQLINGVG